MRPLTLTRQNMRECRWSQPQFRGTPNTDEGLLEAPWECVRTPGEERPVSDADCVGCEHWEPDYLF
jgi:hypothetical protein